MPTSAFSLTRWRPVVAIVGVSTIVALAQENPSLPQWWTGRDVLDTQKSENNYAVANVGQAKWVATQALAELQSVSPEIANQIDLTEIFTSPPEHPDQAWYDSQKTPLLLGQLKAIAKPFYDHLPQPWLAQQAVENGLVENTSQWSGPYPWDASTPTAENYKPANIGQLKSVFSLRFRGDSENNGVGDGLIDLQEYQIIDANADDSLTSIADISPLGDYDGDYISNQTELQQGTDPTVADQTGWQPLQWKDFRNTEQITSPHGQGTALKKISGADGYNADARSTVSFLGDVSITFKSPEKTSRVLVGFNDININASYQELEHSFFIHSNGNVEIYEQGAFKKRIGTYLPSDQFTITRTGTTVTYAQNGTVVYTSTLASEGQLFVDLSHHYIDSILTNIAYRGTIVDDMDGDGISDTWEQQIIDANADDSLTSIADISPLGDYDGDYLSNQTEFRQGTDPTVADQTGWQPLQWKDFRNTQQITSPHGQGTALKKISGANGYNADARSISSFDGDGAITFKCPDYTTRVLVGFNDTNTNASFPELEHCFFIYNGQVKVYEKGVYKGYFGAYVPGDQFVIQRTGTTVTYEQNGTVVYTSTLASEGVVFVDLSFYSIDSTITNVAYRGFSDGDTLDDAIEHQIANALPYDAIVTIQDVVGTDDFDGDGVSNADEIAAETDPTSIYSGDGDVAWPTSALIAHYRLDKNEVQINAEGVFTGWNNHLGSAPNIEQWSSDAVTFEDNPQRLSATETQQMRVLAENTDILTPETNGFTILGSFKTADLTTNIFGGILNNEHYQNSGFRFGKAEDRIRWWSSQSGGTMSGSKLQSKDPITANTHYQFTLHYQPDTYAVLNLNGAYQGHQDNALIKGNTQNIHTQYIGGHRGQSGDWYELIIAKQALTHAERTLLQDYLRAKHQNQGPLAGDSNENNTPDWQDIDGIGLSALKAEPDADGDGLPDTWESENGFDPNDPSDAQEDLDGDGISNLDEYIHALRPDIQDTDGDGVSDYFTIHSVIHLRLDELDGNEVIDSSKNENTATLIGETAEWQTDGGINLGAIDLKSGQDAIILPNNSLDTLTNASVSIWFKTNSQSSVQTLLSAANTEELLELSLQLETDLLANDTVTLKIKGEEFKWLQERSLSDGLWHHIVINRDTHNSQVVLYLDGFAQETKNVQIATLNFNVDAFVMGQQHQSLTDYEDNRSFVGQLDDMRITSSLLSATQVRELFQINDLDADRLPDDYEVHQVGGLNTLISAEADPDGDGLTNKEELEQNSDPLDYYNGTGPVIRIVSGENQNIYNGETTSKPLVFEITNENDETLENAPVTVEHLGLLGFVLDVSGNLLSSSTELRTDSQGRISVLFKAY